MGTSLTELFKRDEPLRWVFTGDSITRGMLHTWGWRDYVELFAERVKTEMGRARDVIVNTAVGGRTTQDLLDDLEWSVLQFEADVVSIMIGMNDASKNTPVKLDAFADNLRDIMGTIKDRCDPVPIVHVPNPVLESGKIERAALPEYADAVRTIAAEFNAILIDHYAHWTRAWDAEDYRAIAWMSDDIHPNEQGHRVFAKLLFETLGIFDSHSATGRLFSF